MCIAPDEVAEELFINYKSSMLMNYVRCQTSVTYVIPAVKKIKAKKPVLGPML